MGFSFYQIYQTFCIVTCNRQAEKRRTLQKYVLLHRLRSRSSVTHTETDVLLFYE